MKLKTAFFSKHFLIILILMIFSGGFVFAGAGKIKPASDVEIVWDGSSWEYSDGTVVEWLDDNDKTSSNGGLVSGPDKNNDFIALCTMNGSITLTLNAPLEISTLFVFGGNVCTINLNGHELTINNTLFLGSSWNNGVDIDNGTIANENGNGGEGSKLGNLSIIGNSGSVIIENFDTSTWGYTNDNPNVFYENGKVNSLLSIGDTVSSFVVNNWNTGSVSQGDGTTGSTIPKITIPENSATNIKVNNISSESDELKNELFDDLIDFGADVTIPYLWTGNGGDNNWETGANWTNNTVPSGNVTAYIGKSNNSPQISSIVDFSSGTIELLNEAVLTIAESSQLSVKNIVLRENGKVTITEGGNLIVNDDGITFADDSSITVNGTLTSTNAFTIDSHFDSASTGTITCSGNSLIVTQTFNGLTTLNVPNGELSVWNSLNCDSINAKNIYFKNRYDVTCESLNATYLEIEGELTVISELSVDSIFNKYKFSIADTVTSIQTISTITNDSGAELDLNVDIVAKEIKNQQSGNITVSDGNYLEVKKQLTNSGKIIGSLKFTGDEIVSGNNQLGGEDSIYKELLINTSRVIQFGGKAAIQSLKVENAKSVRFFSAVTINKVDDSGFTGDFIFEGASFASSGGFGTADGIVFNTTGNITFGKNESSITNFNNVNLTVNNTSNKLNINGTINCNNIVSNKETVINGTVNAKEDITLGNSVINGTITGNNITIGTTSITGDSELKINDTFADGKITLNGSVSSNDSKNLTLNGNVEIPSTSQLTKINLNEGILTTQKIESDTDLSIKAKTQTINEVVIVNGKFVSEGESQTFEKGIVATKDVVIKGNQIEINEAVTAGKTEPFIEGSISLIGTTESSEILTKTLSSTNDITISGSTINAEAITATNDITIKGSTINATALNATNNIIINKDENIEQSLEIEGSVSSKNFEVVSKSQIFKGAISVQNDFVSKGETFSFSESVFVGNDFTTKGETFVFSKEVSVGNDFSLEGNKCDFSKEVISNNMNLSGQEITFAEKVTVNQNAQIQNTGLLKISEFSYGKSFVQKGSESEIGQVMISGSFEQIEQNGETENPTAKFVSNVYFYNSSSNISIGSDKSSTTIAGNLVISKSKENVVAISGNIKSKNLALYSGKIELSGNLYTENDFVILGENYSLKDNQTGIENLYSYNENRPAHWSQASYTFEKFLPDGTEENQNGTKLPDGTSGKLFGATLNVSSGKLISVGKNLYANGTALSLLGTNGSGKWKLIVPNTADATKSFCEVYNSEVSDSVAACSENSKQIQIATLQCTDNLGNENWAFDDDAGTVKITKAYSVSDNVIRVEFNKSVRILRERFTQKQIRFSNTPNENFYFENVYLDEKCTQAASENIDQNYDDENGNKNYFVYVKANSKWNTDATGTFVGEEKSTDYEGNHQNTTICLDFPRAIEISIQDEESLLSYVITDIWGKRLTNYSTRTTAGNQKNPFENVEDKTGPVLISVKTGQENHTEYDATKGAESQPSYDAHNFIEFRYSEFVNFGSENSENCEFFLKADDQGIYDAKNIQVTQKFGALQNEDITQSGELRFAGLAKIQNGKIYTGSKGNTDKFVNALYRFDKYSLRYSIAGYTHPTEFLQDENGNNLKKWIGYIEEAELPSGTVSMISAGKNVLVSDMMGNSQTLVKKDLVVDSSKIGCYGTWDISKPMFAPFRLNEKLPWQENEYIEAIGNNNGFGVTLNRVEFHLFDNTPFFDSSDEAVWITERGWCKNDSSQTLILEDSFCADIFGGSRAFDANKENRTSGGIRFSSLENGVKAFLYTTNTESTPSINFDISKNVIVGTNARLFTGNANLYRDAKTIDGLYFSLPLAEENLEVKTTFKLSYDDKLGFITDLAGNRLKSKTSLSVDRTSPSIEVVLSPIDNKTFYIIFTKKINVATIPLVDNEKNRFDVSESFMELLPQCFELITINSDGTFDLADIQIDSSVFAEHIDIIDNKNYTAFKMSFNREVSFEDVKNVYLRVVNPKKYDYKMCDPITNIKDSYVTLIQDDLGNYIDMFQTHTLSDVAINGINPLYGYNSSIQGEKKQITSSTQDEVSFVVRDWNENQQNYGTFYHDKDITIVCDVDNTSKIKNDFSESINLYFNNDTKNKMTAEQFNKKIGGNLRIWFPNIMENHFDFFTYKKNSSYDVISSVRINKNDISAGLQFDFKKSIVKNWQSGDQISYLFSYLNKDNSLVEICPSPKFNFLTGLYELNKSVMFPLFAIRMKDVNDITSLDLWSFRVKSVTEQRGGVSILNNVINATYGEKAIVKINMPQDGNLDVMVMTLDGNIVTYLNHGATTSGEHYFTWNGTNNAGSKVARGLYFVRVISSTIDETRKIMVVKD